MPERLAKKVLVIGWDAADWKIIDPLIAQGLMPNLKRLIDRGVRGDINSLDPKLSPLLWTSIATGKTADKHGILNFVEPDLATGTLRVSSSTSRKAKALWNIASQNGMNAHVVSWYASHPAEPIRGVNVTNLFQSNPPPRPDDLWPLPPQAVHPNELAGAVAAMRVHPRSVSEDTLNSLVPRLSETGADDRRLSLLASEVARCASVHNITTGLLEGEPDWDLMMAFYDCIDVVGHHFMQYHPPRMAHVSTIDFELYRHVMNGVYLMHDLMLGRLVELAGPEATIVLLSDHGFHSDHLRPATQASLDDEHAAMDATWHRPLGVIVAAGPGIRAGQAIYGATLLDITPTVLTLLGIAPGADMDGRVLVEAIDRPVSSERVFSWDAMPGEAGTHPAGTHVDPVAAAESIRQLVELGYLAPGATGEAQLQLVGRETRFNLGVVFMTTRRAGAAVDLFNSLHAEVPEEPRYAANLAHCLYQVGKHAEACEVLERLIARYPESPDVRMLLASAKLAAGNKAEAQAILEHIERTLPERRDAHIMLAEVYLQQGAWGPAKRVAERLFAADPDDPRVLHALGAAETYLGNLERGADLCLQAIERKHFYADAHYTLGVALTWMKDFPHAIASLKAAVSMQPGHINAHRYLASIYRHLGDRGSARPHREQAERLIASLGDTGHAAEMLMEPPMGPASEASSVG